GSIIVTGGRAHIARASYGSLIGAGEGIRVDSSCQNTTFLNSEVQGRDRGGSRSVRVPTLSLPLPATHPLSAKIEVVGVISPPPQPPPPAAGFGPGALIGDRLGLGINATGLVFRLDGRRHVADIGQAIVDDSGQPIDALRGWQLTFVTDS